MLYFKINISIFRSALLGKSYIYLPLKPIKTNKIKNDNSFKGQNSCTVYILITTSKAQKPNEKLRRDQYGPPNGT